MKRVSGFIVAAAVIVLLAAPYVTRPVLAQSSVPAFSKSAGFADRLYVLDGGLGRALTSVNWLNMLVPPNTPIDISTYAHLIKHGDTWMMFDTSTNDAIASMPNGAPGNEGLRWVKTPAQTMTVQLKLAGITPADIKLIGISHNHPDHTGNVNLFKNSTVLIQRFEYDQVMAKGGSPQGPSATQVPGAPVAIF